MRAGTVAVLGGALLLAGAVGWFLLGGEQGGSTESAGVAPAPRAPGTTLTSGPSRIEVEEGATAAPSTILRGGTLRGHLVRSRDHAPLVGTIRVVEPGGRAFTSESNRGGGFLLEGLPRNVPLDFTATAPGCVPHRHPGLRILDHSPYDLGMIQLGAGVLLEVRVIDPLGAPVAGATVGLRRPGPWEDWLLHPAPPPVESLSTDAAGRALFPAAPAGDWIVEGTAPGLARARARVDLVEGLALRPLHLVLSAAATLSGRVLDESGAPVTGATVNALHPPDWTGAEVAFRGSAVSDGQGRYRIESLPPGTHALMVLSAGGAVEFAGTVDVEQEGTIRDIRLGPRGRLTGRVLDAETGAPVAGATLALDLRMPAGGQESARARTVTDAGGNFSFAGLPRGGVARLEVHAPGFILFPADEEESLSPVVGDPAGAEPLEIRLRRGAVVRGTVRDPDGIPVPSAWVTVFFMGNRQGLRGASGRTDGVGVYRLEGVSAGRVAFNAGARNLHLPSNNLNPGIAGEEPAAAVVAEVPETGELEQDLVLVPDGRVEGRMTRPDGSPASGLRTVLVMMDEGDEWEVEEGPPSAEDGTFVIEDIAPDPGTYRVAARGPGSRFGISESFVLEESGRVQGVIVPVSAPGSVAGVVRRADGKSPAGGSVGVMPGILDDDGEVSEWSGGSDDPLTMPLGSDGTFRIEGLPAGPWTPVAEAPGCLPGTGKGIELASGAAVEGVVVTLEEARVIAGRVVDGGGRPVIGAQVEATRVPEPAAGEEGEESGVRRGDHWQPDAAGTATTGSDGRFRIGGLHSGRHTLLATAAAFAPGRAEAEAGGAEVEVVLPAGLELAGRVLEAGTGKPVPGIRVTLEAPQGEAYEGLDTPLQDSGPEGVFHFRGLPPGIYGVGAIDPREEWVQARSLRAPAGVGDAVVEVQRGLVISGRAVDAAGGPLEMGGLWVQFSTVGDEWSGRHWSSLEEDGSFRYAGLRPGRYRIEVGSTSWEEGRSPYASAAVEVEAGAEDVRIPLHRGRTIKGRVAPPDGIQPSEEISLSVRPSRGAARGEVLYVQVKADGTFESPSFLPDVAQDLQFEWEEQGLVGGVRDVVPGTTGLVVPLTEGLSIAGRVLTPGGEPLAGAFVVVENPLGEPRMGVEAGPDGSFLLERLPPGTWRLHASRAEGEWAPSEKPVEVAAGRTGVEVRVAAGHGFRVRFLEEDGSVPDLDFVFVESTAEGRTESATWGLDEEGWLDLHGLRPCRLRLRAVRAGGRFGGGASEPWAGPFEVPGDAERTVVLR